MLNFWGLLSSIQHWWHAGLHSVTNYYFGECSQYQSKLSSSWSAVGARVFRISEGDSSYSWVLVHSLDLFVKEEF